MDILGDRHEGIWQVVMGRERFVLRAQFRRFTPALLFNYWVRPEFVRHWLADTAEVNGRLGGSFAFSWKNGGRLHGGFPHFDPGRQIAFTYQWDHEVGTDYRKTAVAFKSSLGGGASILLMQGLYGLTPLEQRLRQNHLDFWSAALAHLRDLEPEHHRKII